MMQKILLVLVSSADGTVSNGDTVELRVTSSGSNSTAVTVNVAIGDKVDTWSVTTEAGAGGGGYTPMGDVVSSAVFDLDARISDSYGGTGTTWTNIEPTPADGEAQSDYDMTLVSMTFNGTVGDAAANFESTGTGYAQVASNTTFLENMHKTTGGNAWTVVLLAEFDLVGTDAVFSTANGATNGNTGAGLYHNGTGTMRPYQSNGTTRVQANTEIVSSGAYVCLAMSYDPATGDYQVAVDSDTWESTGSFTPSATTSAPNGS